MDFYVTIIQESLGQAVKYFILFCILLSLVLSIEPIITLVNFTNVFNKTLLKNIPDFTLKNGTLTIEGEMPMVFDYKDDLAFIIDTSGKSDNSVLNNYTRGIFISDSYIATKGIFISDSHMVYKDPSYAEIHNFRDNTSFTFSKALLNNYLAILKIIIPLVPIAMIVAILILKFIGSLVVCAIAAICGIVRGVHLKFDDYYRIALYAVTLPTILQFTIKPIFHIPYFFVIYYAVVIIYINLAFSRIKRKTLAQSQNSQPFM